MLVSRLIFSICFDYLTRASIRLILLDRMEKEECFVKERKLVNFQIDKVVSF